MKKQKRPTQLWLHITLPLVVFFLIGERSSAACEALFVTQMRESDYDLVRNQLLETGYGEVEIPEGLLSAQATNDLLKKYGRHLARHRSWLPFGIRPAFDIRNGGVPAGDDVLSLVRRDVRLAPLIPAFEWARKVGTDVVGPIFVGTKHPRFKATVAVAIIKKKGVVADRARPHTDAGLFTIFVVLNSDGNSRLMTRIFDERKLRISSMEFESKFLKVAHPNWEQVYLAGYPVYMARKSEIRTARPGNASLMRGTYWPQELGVGPLYHAAPVANGLGLQPADRVAIALTFDLVDSDGLSTDSGLWSSN